MIPFGEWLPDFPAYSNPGCTEALNCRPIAGGYRELLNVSSFSDALDSRCLGHFSMKSSNLTPYVYVGDDSKLYELTGTSWTDRSRGAGYSTGSGENWEFTQWGDKVIATNYSDEIQIASTGGDFSDLTGSPPQARHITSVGNFVVVGNITSNPYRIQWSGINDETAWGSDPDTQADYQDLRSGGPIQAIRGGEFGVIFCEDSIYRMTYVGSPLIFQLDEVIPGIGTPAPNSVSQFGDTIYFLSKEGFYALVNGTQLIPIGSDKVDRYFWNDVNQSFIHNVIGAVDYVEQLVYWIYPGPGASEGLPNRVIIYDYIDNKWSHASFGTMEWIKPTYGYTSYTLEGLDTISTNIDTGFTESLDSRQYGGDVQLGFFMSDHKLGFQSGDPLDAKFETTEAQITPGKLTMLTSVRPLIEQAGSLSVQVSGRNRLDDTVVWSSIHNVLDSGRASVRKNARYHRARVNVSGGFRRAIGIDISAIERGRR